MDLRERGIGVRGKAENGTEGRPVIRGVNVGVLPPVVRCN